MTFVGIDVGGSGSRLLVVGGTQRHLLHGPGVRIDSAGTSAAGLVDRLIGRARSEHPRDMSDLRAVGIGATGLASLTRAPEETASLLGESLGAPVALAIDAVTAHLGALDGAGGSVVALGTGAIAVSHPGPGGPGRWSRVDGWGHLLGDRGGGAWVGRLALEAAVRTHDGIDEAGSVLLEMIVARWGPVEDWPQRLYTGSDRAATMASLVREVTAAAEAGDHTSQVLLRRAGAAAAESLVAALARPSDPPVPTTAALTGGLRGAGLLVESLRRTVAAADPRIEMAEAVGRPVEGALRMAELLDRGRLEAQEGFVWHSTSEASGTEQPGGG